MIIRKTTYADVDAVAEIYENAKIFMRKNGNHDQWNLGYPNRDTVLEDIEAGVGYVCEDEGEVVATFMFNIGDDKTYKIMYEGAWKNDRPYAVIHRVAVKKHGCGIIDFCFEECFKKYPNLKIDTHRDNIPMQRVLERNGFVYCGIIHIETGDERLAYQKDS